MVASAASADMLESTIETNAAPATTANLAVARTSIAMSLHPSPLPPDTLIAWAVVRSASTVYGSLTSPICDRTSRKHASKTPGSSKTPGRSLASGRRPGTLAGPGRARWGVSGSLNPTSAPAGPNAVRGTVSTGSGLAHVASMVGFRALGASEPRQVRKEAALRIPSQVPRYRLTGAGDAIAPRGSLSKTERVTGHRH